MKYTIQSSRGPIRFHSVGEPIAGIPVDIGNHAKNDQDSLTWKMKYAKSKISLLPAFGDSIGKDVSKAELALANIYIGEAVETVADLLAALQTVLSTYRTFRNVPKNLQEWTCIDDEAFKQGLSAIRKAKGGA